MPHAPLNPIDHPSLAVDRDDGDLISCDVPAVLQDSISVQDEFADLVDVDLARLLQGGPYGNQVRFEVRIFAELFGCVPLLFPKDVFQVWIVTDASSTR